MLHGCVFRCILYSSQSTLLWPPQICSLTGLKWILATVPFTSQSRAHFAWPTCPYYLKTLASITFQRYWMSNSMFEFSVGFYSTVFVQRSYPGMSTEKKDKKQTKTLYLCLSRWCRFSYLVTFVHSLLLFPMFLICISSGFIHGNTLPFKWRHSSICVAMLSQPTVYWSPT